MSFQNKPRTEARMLIIQPFRLDLALKNRWKRVAESKDKMFQLPNKMWLHDPLIPLVFNTPSLIIKVGVTETEQCVNTAARI